MSKRRRIALGTVTGVSLNDDFGNAASDVLATLRGRRGGRVLRWFRRSRPAWVGVQEGKREEYAAQLPDDYLVTQRMTTEATRGVAVIVDLHQLHTVGNATDDPTKLGEGYQQFTPAGGGILARGVAWRDVEKGRRGSRRLVRLASAHRHPKRQREQWDEFDEALAAWVEQSPIPVWLTIDANTHEPQGLAHQITARVRGHHLDHHFITGGLTFRSKPFALPWRSSNHRAVAQRVHIPKQPKEK